jgi:hypothetical protein
VPQAHELYDADYTLIRPDQIVAWRGNSCSQAEQVFGQILGAARTAFQAEHSKSTIA